LTILTGSDRSRVANTGQRSESFLHIKARVF